MRQTLSKKKSEMPARNMQNLCGFAVHLTIMGKSACASKQVPEDVLKLLVPEDFKEIRVPIANKIIIVLQDGSKIEKTWQYKSRSESWTEEMRKQASERS